MMPEEILMEMPPMFEAFCTSPVELGGLGWKKEKMEALTEGGVGRVQAIMDRRIEELQKAKADREVFEAQEAERQEAETKKLYDEFGQKYPELANWSDLLLDRAADEVAASNVAYRDRAEFDEAVANHMREMIRSRIGGTEDIRFGTHKAPTAPSTPPAPPAPPKTLAGGPAPAGGGQPTGQRVVRDDSYYYQDD